MSIISGTSNLGSSECDVIPQDGLVASYLLTGVAEDETGNHDGAENNENYTYDDERGVVFRTTINSTRENIEMNGLCNNALVGKSITISAWLKVDAWGSTGDTYINLASGTTDYKVNSGSSQFNIAIGSSEYLGVSYKSPNNTGYGTYNDARVQMNGVVLGRWYHVIGLYDKDNGKLRLYLDTVNKGELDVSTDGMISGTANDSHNYIGDHSDGQGQELWENTMSYSNVHIYDRALTDLEIQQIYDVEKEVHDIPIDNGLIAYYPLDGNSLDNAISPSYDGSDSSVSYVYDSEIDDVVAKYSAAITSRTSLNDKPIDNTDTYSISGWVKIENTGYFGIYCSNTEGWYQYGIEINGYIDKITFSHVRSDAVESNNEVNTPQKADGIWHHYTAVRSGLDITLFEDGVLVDSNTLINNTTTNYANAYLGAFEDNNTNTPQVENKLRNVRCYNRALSELEISAIYEYEKPKSAVCLPEFKRGLTADTHDVFGDGSCVATYQLNNDATDLGGNYDGTETSMSYSVDGVFDDCGVFDGSSSYISTTPQLNNILSDYTISAWVKTSSPDAGSRIYSIGSGDGSIGQSDKKILFFEVSSNGTDSKLGLVGSYNGGFHYSTVDIELNKWVFVIGIVKSTGETMLYIDGALDSISSIDLTSSTPTHSYIGSDNTNTVYFDGEIDQVRIFNRVITADEVAILYNENKLGV